MRKKIIIIFILIALLIISGLVWLKSEIKEIFLRVDSAIYAVHLNNGHIYFGKIRSITPETIVMEDARILQAVQTQINAPLATSTSFQVQSLNNNQAPVYGIVKRGDLNKAMPTDNVLFINRYNVLFWEKLNNDSDIVKLMEIKK